MKFNFKIIIIFIIFVKNIESSDITRLVFGTLSNNFIPAAFGDFDSNELTDVFMIKDNGKSIQILLAYDTDPLLREGPKCDFEHLHITSIVPGDFDGDAFMDVLITSRNNDGNINVYINWGSPDNLTCALENNPTIENLIIEPVTLDYDSDMIIDLFAENSTNHRNFYIFGNKREKPEIKLMPTISTIERSNLKKHAHAYLDLNNDFIADLFLTTNTHFEIWNGIQNGFIFNKTIKKPFNDKEIIYGQSLFLDIDLKGELNQILPICYDYKCQNSSILIRDENGFHDIQVNFNIDNNLWGFVKNDDNEIYLNEITLRGGDFNMDGYPDLLVTLQRKSSGKLIQTFLLENIPSEKLFGTIKRTFTVKWKTLLPFSNGTVMGAFYDFYQDGILDVILVEKTHNKGLYRTVAFRNTLDYDANFIKVIVLTGLKNDSYPTKLTPLGHRKKTYGTNLPGPRIEYFTTTQEGYEQHGASAQLSQSAYFSLQLPYTIFGLGRTPNFVDTLTVGLLGHSHNWTQIIPNSQMVVIPSPINKPKYWKAFLFVTPSKLILMSVVALGATCLVIMFIILGLYIKEKREDKIEKLSEAHRFHYDAM